MPIKFSTLATVFRWKPAAWLRVSGEDAFTFLQGQFTNDLRALPVVPAVYGLWLTVKGKVLADSFVVREGGPNEFWIGSYYSAVSVIRERLESHVIADDVTIEDRTAAWTGITVFDPASTAPRIDGELAGDDAVVFPGRRDRTSHLECVYSTAGGEPGWLREITRPALGDDEVVRRRIAAGIPAVPADVGPGDLPNEGGLEADAISYTKGCYLGQEVMARLKSMGQVRRRLLRVAGAGTELPATPAPLFVGLKQVGELRSIAREGGEAWIGLAMISLLHAGAGAKLALIADGAPAVRLLDQP